MASGRRRSRSPPREPYPPARPGWNVWRPDPYRDDRVSYRRPGDVYTDRRNDGPSRRDYGERSGPSGPNRSYDDYTDQRDRQAHRDNISLEQRRRRASMNEANISSGIPPQVNRNPSFDGVARNTYTESPLRSPVSAVSSIQSSNLTNDARPSKGLQVDPSIPKADEVVTDPRLSKPRSRSVPAAALNKDASREEVATPVSPNMNMDGSSDIPKVAGYNRSPTSPDVVMADGQSTDSNVEKSLVDSLLRFIEPAVASGIQQQRLNIVKSEFKTAREETDQAAKQPKLPPVILEGHKLKRDQAAKNYKVVSEDLQDIHATRSSSASGLVKQIAALVSHISLQHCQETQSKQASKVDSMQQEVTERLDSFKTELTTLCESNRNTEEIEAIKKNQIELETLIKRAQPQFEKNIDFLMDKHKVQQSDFSKLRSEIVSLRDKQKDQESEISKLRTENASLHNRQDEQPSDSSKLWAENDSLRSEMTAIRKEMRDQRETFTNQLQQHVLKSEFSDYKAISRSHRTHDEEVSVQRASIDAEVKALGAQIVNVKQMLEHKLSQHVLKADFDSFKAESEMLSTGIVSHQGINANTSYDDANLQIELHKLKEDIEAINNKATGFAAARQSAVEAMTKLERCQQQLDQIQKVSAKSESQMTGLDTPNPPSEQNHSLLDTEKEIRNLWAEVSSLKAQPGSTPAQIGQIQTAATDPASSSTKKALSDAESHAMANRINLLSGQILDVKSELKKLRERQAQSPPSDAPMLFPSDAEGRVQNLEKWTETHKAPLANISANMGDGKTAVGKKIAEVEISVWNVTQNLQVLQTRVDKHQTITATKQEVANISSQLNQLSAQPPSQPTPEAPSALGAKERMLLNTLEFVPKRLNNLENTVSEIVKHEGQSSIQSQPKPPPEALKEYDARLAATVTNLNQIKVEVTQKVNGWEEGLRQVDSHTQARISDLNQSIEVMRTDLKASEHALRSLTARYNNLTTEGMARKIADIVQPLPAQSQQEQANLKATVGVNESEIDKLKKSFDTLSEAVADGQSSDTIMDKARELFAEVKDLKDLQETLLSMTTRVTTLENVARPAEASGELGDKVTDLLSQFEKGRDDLRTDHNELKKRVQKLERRTVQASEWAGSDEEDAAQATSKASEKSSQADSNALLSSFKPRYAPAPVTTTRPASRSSPSSSSARGSPTVKDSSQASTQGSVPFASRISQEPAQPRDGPLRSLTSRIAPPRSLADRIESPRVGRRTSTAQKRQHSISDGEEGANGDTVRVQPPGKGDGGKRKGKKFPRLV